MSSLIQPMIRVGSISTKQGFKRSFLMLGIGALLASSLEAQVATLSTVPSNIVAGQAAQLSLSGPSQSPRCPPVNAKLEQTGRNLVVLLTLDQTFRACTGTAAWTFGLGTRTFSQDGAHTVLVVDADTGTLLSRQTLNVQGNSSADARSTFSVSGSWYQPTFSGSGLMLHHIIDQSSDKQRESVWGTWHNYRESGESSWFSLQGGKWVTPTRYEGIVYETRGATSSGVCTLEFPPNAGCPNPLRPIALIGISAVGSYIFDLKSATTANLTLRFNEAFGPQTFAVEKL